MPFLNFQLLRCIRCLFLLKIWLQHPSPLKFYFFFLKDSQKYIIRKHPLAQVHYWYIFSQSTAPNISNYIFVTLEISIDTSCLHNFLFKTDKPKQCFALGSLLIASPSHYTLLIPLSSFEILIFIGGMTNTEWVPSEVIEMISSNL